MTKARNLTTLAAVTSTSGNTVYINGNVSFANANLLLGANSVNSTSLTTTGVVANSYGNTTAIPVITVDAAGRITNATTSSVSGVTGLSFAPANSTITVSTSTTNFDATVTSGNSTVQGLLKIVDSVSNTSSSIAGSANSVTTAYLLAANAVSNATAYAASAYSNATSYADTAAGTAYSNAVSVAASDATTKAGTAYSNATAYADTKAGTAYSNAVSVAASDATTKAGTAYTNATSYADTKAGTAYSNAVSVAASDATTKAGTAYSNATAYADTKAATAYSNATSYADTKAATAYSNATSYADTKAANAYSNVFNGGTFSGAVTVQANLTANNVRMNGDLQIDGNLTVLGNTVSIYVSTLNVEDNMIYLNSNSTVSHPDLGFAGNYNDGSYKHAGLFRDATDGVWKFFHGYTPEPDASAFIDTSNASFTFSNLQINYVIGNVTGSANSATYLGGNTATTLRSYSDTMAGTAYSNATAYADTKAATAYSNAVSVAASDATTKAGTAYSNATTYAATIAGTAYSNATSYAATIAGTAYSNAIAFAANASNITSGTLSASRLPATYLTAESDTLATVTARGSTTSGAMTISSGTTDQGLTMTVSDASWNYIGFSHGATRKAYFGLDSSGNPQWGSDSGAFSITGNYTTIGTSARSPLFYDSDDTAYYVNPNGASNIGSLTSTSVTNVQTGTGSFVYQQITNTDAAGVYAYLQLTTSGSGSGYLIKNRTTGNSMTNQSLYLWNDPGPIEFVPSGNTAIRTTISTGGSMTVATDIRSPIFYDSNDTAYYLNPSSSGGIALETIGEIRLKNNAGTYTHFNYSNGGTSNYIRGTTYFDGSTVQFSSGNLRWSGAGYDNDDTTYYVDPNSRSVLSALNIGSATTIGSGKLSVYAGGASGVGWATGFNIGDSSNYTTWIQDAGVSRFRNLGTGGMDWYNSSASTRLLYLSDGGSFTISGDIRAPIFYDSNDTGYYVDSNSTSRMYLINANILRSYTNIYTDNNYGYGHVGVYDSYRYQGVFAMGDAYKLPADGTTTGNLYGIAWSHPNAGGTASNLASHGMLILENGSFRGAWGGGRFITTSDVRGTLFYDYNDTSYYVDPNSTSQLSYVLANNWFRAQNNTGFYLQSYGVHFYHVQDTYGSWDVLGYQNSYAGIRFADCNRITWMHDTSGNGGMYNYTYWIYYWLVANACLGVGTSATSSSYRMYVDGGIYATGNIVAYSDARKKTNVVTVDNALETVSKLRGVFYNRIDSYNEKINTEKRQIGVIAQEVNLVLPEVVTYAKDVDEYGVQYGNMAGLFIEALKEMKNKIEALEQEVKELKGEL